MLRKPTINSSIIQRGNFKDTRAKKKEQRNLKITRIASSISDKTDDRKHAVILKRW